MKYLILAMMLVSGSNAFAARANGSSGGSCTSKGEADCKAPDCSWTAASSSGIPGFCSTGGAMVKPNVTLQPAVKVKKFGI